MAQRVVVYDLLNQVWQTFTHEQVRTYGYVFQPTAVLPPRVASSDVTGNVIYQDLAATSDGTYSITRRWQSSTLGGDMPMRSKEINGVALEYQSQYTSYITVGISDDRGASLITQAQLELAATSVISRVEWHCHVSARYPVFEIQSSATTQMLYRAEVGWNVRGR